MNENRTTQNAPSHGNGHGKTLAGEAAMWGTPIAAVRIWPTPTASDHEGNGFRSGDRSTEPKLSGAAQMWGTPVARDDQKSPEAHIAMKQRALGRTPDAAITSLTVQVKQWPTPQAADSHKIGSMTPETAARQAAKGHQEMLAGSIHTASGPLAATTQPDGESGSLRVDLNPRFVEALMGVPQNWLTPSTSVETGSYQQWLQLHSLSLPDGSVSTCGATT